MRGVLLLDGPVGKRPAALLVGFSDYLLSTREVCCKAYFMIYHAWLLHQRLVLEGSKARRGEESDR